MSVDGMIANARSGRCMCGREEGVLYGPSPFGYGPTCVACQREWGRQHGGAFWEPESAKRARLDAAMARARADGREEGEVVRDWNQGRGLFKKPPVTDARLGERWIRDYIAHLEAEGAEPRMIDVWRSRLRPPAPAEDEVPFEEIPF